MPDSKPLADHPRLYLGSGELDRLRADPQTHFLELAARQIAEDADRFAEMPPLTYARNVHNEHLIRARETQGRVITLLARWAQTDDASYRHAVVAHAEMIDAWECSPWLPRRQANNDPNAIFDLLYGYNSVTSALASYVAPSAMSAVPR